MYYCARPPLNRQNYGNSCWAAAIDSFSRANSFIPTLRESDLAQRWGEPAIQYGLSFNALNGLMSSTLSPHGCQKVFKQILLLPYDIEDKLRQSHVVLIWQVTMSEWHAGLVYGIDNRTISYMETRTGQLRVVAWNYFLNPTGYHMIWRP